MDSVGASFDAKTLRSMADAIIEPAMAGSWVPDQNIDDGYLLRWWIMRGGKNGLPNIYLHRFGRSDEGPPHDHPWDNVTIPLIGSYAERIYDPATGLEEVREVSGGDDPVARSAYTAHRIEVVEWPVWTLFVTGPNVRKWGFYTRDGWRYWKHHLGLEPEVCGHCDGTGEVEMDFYPATAPCPRCRNK